MAGQNGSASSQHALLIGIDCYLPGSRPDGVFYPNLGGCVRDVSHVESFLLAKLGVPEGRIIKLLAARQAGSTEPAGPRDVWPTYANVVDAFARLTAAARPGDQVYVHYSGHGGRAKTLVPEQKGDDGLDEGLVPADIHTPDGQYLRDIELAVIFQRMVEKGVRLSVVLDSCHSGGAVRGPAEALVAVRGVGQVDRAARPRDSRVAPLAELGATWDRLTVQGTRNVALGSGWLPEPEGYVLLAACRPSESAYEYAFDGRERNGALTYWLLDSLRQFGTGLTFKMLHERILAKVHSQFAQQTPQLQGAGETALFGGQLASSQPSVSVLQVDATGQRVRLGAGQAMGVEEGSQFAIYPFGVSDFRDAGQRLALATVSDLGATASWAKITATMNAAPIEQGSPAVLLGSVKLQRKVGFARRKDLSEQLSAAQKDAALSALEAVRLALAGNAWVAEAAANDSLEYQVAVNERGEYEIWDPAGKVITLRPALLTTADGAAARLVERLAHLAKYHAAKQLENHDPFSPLAGKLVVELAGIQDDYRPGQRPDPKPMTVPGNTPVVKTGQWAFLRIRNASSQPLNVTVLDLQPDWGISQVYPRGAGDLNVELEAGKELPLLPLRAGLPPSFDADSGRDLLKVFASVGPANYRILELPALDQGTRSAAQVRSARGARPSPLEQLLASFASEQPSTRTFSTAAFASEEWTTDSVEVEVQRAT